MNAILKAETMNAVPAPAPVLASASAPAAPPAKANILSEKACLVDFSVFMWEGRKTDKAASAKVTTEAKADAGSAKVSKALISKAALAKLQTIRSAAYADHIRRTLPWLDNGQRILPAAGYIDYYAAMAGHMAKFEAARAEFQAAYPGEVLEAQTMLGHLFDASDYPPVSEIMRRFRFPKPRQLPFPAAGDFRVDIGQAQLEIERAEIAANVNAMVKGAIGDCFARIAEKVGHMAEKLQEFRPAKKGERATPLHASLIGNVADLIAILPSLNITNDPALSAVLKRMEGLCVYDADTLKEHADCRKEIADKAAAIVADVSAFIM